MSPVAHFEESARTVWRSDLELVEKRRRLKGIRSAIVHYIERLDAKRAESAEDPWRVRSFDRVRGYLTHLAADVQELALDCERALPKKSPSSVAGSPYAA